MKVQFIGATRRVGISGKTGNSYDMCMVSYAIPVESKKTDAYTYTGVGSEVKEIELDPSALPQFAEFKTGQAVALSLTPNPRKPQVTICDGVKAA